TNDVCFIEPADFDAHEVRISIAQGRTLDDASRPREYTQEQYLKGAGAMRELFADLPEALDNTIEIAKRCNLEVRMGEPFRPASGTPDGAGTADHLRRVPASGLAARRGAAGRPDSDGLCAQRLERELGVICRMGFEGYCLIVAVFINGARQNSIPV